MEEKRTGLFENGLIWFGAGVSIAEILTGTYLAPLGMGKGLAAIIVGHPSITKPFKSFTVARIFCLFFSIRPCCPMRIHFNMDRPPHSHRRKKLHFISFLLTT